MKLGIFAYHIFPGKSGGIEQYSQRLVYALGKYSNIETIVFCSPRNKKIFENYKSANVSIFQLPARYKYIKLFLKNKFIRNSWIYKNPLYLGLLNLLGDCAKEIEKKVDLVHFTSPLLEWRNFNIPTIISLHDIQQKHFPDFFSKQQRKYRDIDYKISAELSTRIIVSFDHVKKDIIKFYNIGYNKIDVCTPGHDREELIDIKNSQKILYKYKIPKSFLIYPAQTWPHKNHIRLVRALKILHDKFDKKIHLICTGHKTKFYFKIKKEIKRLGLGNFVIFTDFIPQKDLNDLIAKARLMVIPSLYEAGSFPLIESMAQGVPVICSDVTALPEQIKDRRFIFNPYNSDDIARKINEMLDNKELRKENIDNAEKRIDEISWDKQIQNFINSYKKALE